MTGATGVIAWWTQFYATHDAAQLGAACGHLGAIAYALSHALRGDRAALRLTASRGKPAARAKSTATTTADIASITRAHRHVIGGLCVALLTGLMQLAAQLDYLPQSPVFWVKMSVLVLLLANGRMIQLAGRRLGSNAGHGTGAVDPGSTGLRAAAIRSIVLWCVMIVMGLLLTTVRPG